MRFCILVAAIIVADAMKPHYILTLRAVSFLVLLFTACLALTCDVIDFFNTLENKTKL